MSGGSAVEAMVPPLNVVVCPRGFLKHGPKTTITLEALLTHSYCILTSNTLCRHVNDDDKFDGFDKVVIVAQC